MVMVSNLSKRTSVSGLHPGQAHLPSNTAWANTAAASGPSSASLFFSSKTRSRNFTWSNRTTFRPFSSKSRPRFSEKSPGNISFSHASSTAVLVS